MAGKKAVKDVMVNINQYPHVPYWFSVEKAAKIIKVSLLDTKEYPEPLALLVFDEKYNLMGTIAIKDIFREIENAKGSKKLLERPVSEVMAPAKFSVAPDDAIGNAASIMNQNNIELLPVIDAKKKFVGLVRIIEIFDEISTDIVKE